MSELPELPPAPRLHRPPPEGGLEAAMREGRRRRNRAVAAVAGAAAALVLVVPLAGLLPGTGADRLVVGEQAGPGGTASATATPTPSRAPDPAAYREDTVEAAEGGGDCGPGRSGGEALCRYSGGTAAGTAVAPGEPVELVLGLCLPVDASGDHVLSFGTGQEKEVVARSADGTEVFVFSRTVRYVDGAHERRVRRGACVAWTGRWTGVTTAGQPVPAGQYTVELTVRADAESRADGTDPGEPALQATLTVPVTVTA